MRSFASCREELSVEGVDGAVLAGTLALPVGAGVFRAVVGVHGSGGGTRQTRGLQHLQSLFPRHGIVILTFDRRGESGSTGAPQAAFFIYMTMGVFVLLASFDARRFRDLLWFLACVNLAHGAVMAVDAYRMQGEWSHMVGDIPLTFGWSVLLAVFIAHESLTEE